jgi:hypothetical protein
MKKLNKIELKQLSTSQLIQIILDLQEIHNYMKKTT